MDIEKLNGETKPVEEPKVDTKPEVQEEGKPEKTFTQSELNKIVEDRVKRVKSENPSDYEDLRAIASDLEEYGFVGTVAEKKAALSEARKQVKLEREVKELEEEAASTGHSPEILKKLKDAEKKLKESESKLNKINDVEEGKRKELEKKTELDEGWKRQYNEFIDSHEDIDVDELIKDKKFLKYAKKHTGELGEIYDDYAELMEETSNSIAEKFKRSESRSTGGGKNNPSSGGSKLDTRQQGVLDDWNKRYPQMKMTPKEFLKQ